MVRIIKELLSNHGFIRYLRNTSWLFFEKILRLITGILVGAWVARYLGPEQFGLLSYTQSFVGLFSVIATLGLDAIVVRQLVNNEEKRDKLLGTSFVLKLLGTIVVLAILAVSINFTSNDGYTNLLVFIIASAIFFQSFNVVDLYFQSKVLSKYAVYANIISLIISSIIKIVLILISAKLVYFVCVVVFDSIVLSLGYIYFYTHHHLSIKAWKFDRIVAFDLLKDSWPLVLSGMAISIYLKIDQVMIKEILNTEMVGQYAAAVKLSEVWYFIPVIISASVFPAILSAKKHSEELYYSRIKILLKLMVWIAIAIAIPVTLLSGWLVLILFGEKFNLAGNILAIHVWAGIFAFLTIASGRWYIAENLQKLAFWRAISGLIVNIALNLILIQKYGPLGAAVATLISQIIAAYIFDLFGSRTRKLFILKSLAFFPFK